MSNDEVKENKKFKSKEERAQDIKRFSQAYNRLWTQFELDLIACVRDEYPIIYQKPGDIKQYQRAVEIKKAWREIGLKFEVLEIDVDSIKTRWRTLRNTYFKVKKNKIGLNHVGTSKYLDGTLSFLDSNSELDTSDADNQLQNETNKATKEPSSQAINDSSNIRHLIHEEIDIDDEYPIKVERDQDVDDAMMISDEENNIHEPLNTWQEEELLNATRVTQEMVEQIIYIKNKRYFLEPVTIKTDENN